VPSTPSAKNDSISTSAHQWVEGLARGARCEARRALRGATRVARRVARRWYAEDIQRRTRVVPPARATLTGTEMVTRETTLGLLVLGTVSADSSFENPFCGCATDASPKAPANRHLLIPPPEGARGDDRASAPPPSTAAR